MQLILPILNTVQNILYLKNFLWYINLYNNKKYTNVYFITKLYYLNITMACKILKILDTKTCIAIFKKQLILLK